MVVNVFSKMAEAVSCVVDSSLKSLVNIAEGGSRMRKELKEEILTTVSNIKNAFTELRAEVCEKNRDKIVDNTIRSIQGRHPH